MMLSSSDARQLSSDDLELRPAGALPTSGAKAQLSFRNSNGASGPSSNLNCLSVTVCCCR